jgi:dsRNA-specific ribonuclease
MRSIILVGLFALAVVAIPLAVEIQSGKHIERRGSTDAVIADVVKALIAFGAFIWGGGIVAKKAVNYYFEKKAQLDQGKERRRGQNQTMVQAAVKKSNLPPYERKKVEEEDQ